MSPLRDKHEGLHARAKKKRITGSSGIVETAVVKNNNASATATAELVPETAPDASAIISSRRRRGGGGTNLEDAKPLALSTTRDFHSSINESAQQQESKGAVSQTGDTQQQQVQAEIKGSGQRDKRPKRGRPINEENRRISSEDVKLELFPPDELSTTTSGSLNRRASHAKRALVIDEESGGEEPRERPETMAKPLETGESSPRGEAPAEIGGDVKNTNKLKKGHLQLKSDKKQRRLLQKRSETLATAGIQTSSTAAAATLDDGSAAAVLNGQDECVKSHKRRIVDDDDSVEKVTSFRRSSTTQGDGDNNGTQQPLAAENREIAQSSIDQSDGSLLPSPKGSVAKSSSQKPAIVRDKSGRFAIAKTARRSTSTTSSIKEQGAVSAASVPAPGPSSTVPRLGGDGGVVLSSASSSFMSSISVSPVALPEAEVPASSTDSEQVGLRRKRKRSTLVSTKDTAVWHGSFKLREDIGALHGDPMFLQLDSGIKEIQHILSKLPNPESADDKIAVEGFRTSLVTARSILSQFNEASMELEHLLKTCETLAESFVSEMVSASVTLWPDGLPEDPGDWATSLTQIFAHMHVARSRRREEETGSAAAAAAATPSIPQDVPPPSASQSRPRGRPRHSTRHHQSRTSSAPGSEDGNNGGKVTVGQEPLTGAAGLPSPESGTDVPGEPILSDLESAGLKVLDGLSARASLFEACRATISELCSKIESYKPSNTGFGSRNSIQVAPGHGASPPEAVTAESGGAGGDAMVTAANQGSPVVSNPSASSRGVGRPRKVKRKRKDPKITPAREAAAAVPPLAAATSSPEGICGKVEEGDTSSPAKIRRIDSEILCVQADQQPLDVSGASTEENVSLNSPFPPMEADVAAARPSSTDGVEVRDNNSELQSPRCGTPHDVTEGEENSSSDKIIGDCNKEKEEGCIIEGIDRNKDEDEKLDRVSASSPAICVQRRSSTSNGSS